MSLRQELHKLYKHQKAIMLVYHPKRKSTWSDRCLYLDTSSGYSETKPYNHRCILNCEVVIEYDEFKDPKKNLKLAEKVCERLRADKIKYSKWTSGNKSTHVHILLDIPETISNRKLLKRCFMRHYGTMYMDPDTEYLYWYDTKPSKLTKDHRILPDLALDSDNHLIRAEYGVHEKTQKTKSPLGTSPGYAEKKSPIPEAVWDYYVNAQRTVLTRKTTMDIKEVMDHPGVKMLLDGNTFREIGDGRQRGMYHLITILKNKYEKEALIDKIDEWYRYATKHRAKLDRGQIRYHVEHNIRKGYSFSISKFNDFLEEIGREDLIVDDNSNT